MAFLFAGIVVCWLFYRKAFIQCIFALFVFIGLYFIAPVNTPEFPWRAVFFFALGGLVLAFHFWAKPKSEKSLYQSEKGYQQWWDSKIDPEIKAFYDMKEKY